MNRTHRHGGRCSFISRLSISLLLAMSASVFAEPTSRASIEWDPSTLRCVQRGGCYARIVRDGSQLLCCYEHRGHVWVRASVDEGKTWQPGVDVAGYDGGYAANPELLVCPQRIVLFFNGRPRDSKHVFTISQACSTDHGKTWTAARDPIFTTIAGASAGCYEPAAVRAADGEIALYFANEAPYADSLGRPRYQEITVVHSRDDGESWSNPTVASYRPAGRDGMAVPLTLADGTDVISIEDNGVLDDHLLKPMIVRVAATSQPVASTRATLIGERWNPFRSPLSPGVYGGAPYLCQFANAPTALVFQTCVPPLAQHATVYLGDATAHDFVKQRDPFKADAYSMWNSIFIRNQTTLMLISTAEIDGTSGVWTIDGVLTRDK